MHCFLCASLLASLLPSSCLATPFSPSPDTFLETHPALETRILRKASTKVLKQRYTTGCLDDAAKAAGKHYFGTATDPVDFGSAAFLGILNGTGEVRDFGGVSVENAMYEGTSGAFFCFFGKGGGTGKGRGWEDGRGRE